MNMNIVGERIKELRRKQDLTQEKLADFLCVSPPTISKWECGINSPDISLLLPLARVFGITVDELLGATPVDEARAKYDAAYDRYWQKEMADMYHMAQAAVAEFPNDMKYLNWLANMEYYVAFHEEEFGKGEDDFYTITLEKSIKHYKTVLENTTNDNLRHSSLHGLLLNLKFLNRFEEAKQYAALFPKEQVMTQDEAMILCLTGEEQLAAEQTVIYHQAEQLLNQLFLCWGGQQFPQQRRYRIDAMEKIVNALITDENYLGFSSHLMSVHLCRAEFAIQDQKPEEALAHLQSARNYADEDYRLSLIGTYRYTSPLLDHMESKYTHLPSYTSLASFKEQLDAEIFAPLREREEFRTLLK